MLRITAFTVAAVLLAAAAHAGPRSSGGETKALANNGTALTGAVIAAPATVTGIELPPA